jgi:hypothetical protein
MDKKIANLQAQINLLEESLAGMEELIIHLMDEKSAARNPLRWRQPVMAKA